jgi:hypothetical protein
MPFYIRNLDVEDCHILGDPGTHVPQKLRDGCGCIIFALHRL